MAWRGFYSRGPPKDGQWTEDGITAISRLASFNAIQYFANLDSVKSRLDSEDGMALAEFCYPLLQAWDWWHMYQNHNVKVQIGGADQFGNIITGIEALKPLIKVQSLQLSSEGEKSLQTDVPSPLTGFTVPLLTTSSGEKFGKSAGNAVWLDPTLTTPFDLYAVRRP
jgi:tyrosyl-tRNA synthetase